MPHFDFHLVFSADINYGGDQSSRSVNLQHLIQTEAKEKMIHFKVQKRKKLIDGVLKKLKLHQVLIATVMVLVVTTGTMGDDEQQQAVVLVQREPTEDLQTAAGNLYGFGPGYYGRKSCIIS